MDDPAVFEFGQPVRGTYPPWDDPSYWNEGVRPSFRLRSQFRVLVESAFVYEKMFLGESGLIAGALIFVLLGGKPTRQAIASNWPLLAAAMLSIGAYSLVFVLSRYVGASMVLLWVAVFAGIRLPDGPQIRIKMESVSKYVCAAVAFTILLSVAGHMADVAYAKFTVGAEPSSKDQIKVAAELQSLGLRQGDEVAVIGYGLTNHWARLGRFRIVAEAASGGGDFWASSPERRNAAYECMKGAGARAVIAWSPPSSAIDARWKQISDSQYYAYFLPK